MTFTLTISLRATVGCQIGISTENDELRDVIEFLKFSRKRLFEKFEAGVELLRHVSSH